MVSSTFLLARVDYSISSRTPLSRAGVSPLRALSYPSVSYCRDVQGVSGGPNWVPMTTRSASLSRTASLPLIQFLVKTKNQFRFWATLRRSRSLFVSLRGNGLNNDGVISSFFMYSFDYFCLKSWRLNLNKFGELNEICKYNPNLV